MSRRALVGAAALGFAAPAIAAMRRVGTVEVVVGLDRGGYPDAEWIQAIADRVERSTLATIRETARPLSAQDAAWITVVRDVAAAWRDHIPELDVPFRKVTPPRPVRVLLGNQGGDDGFTSGADTMVMDLTALQRAYGDALQPANREQIWRLLSHEYTHLLIHPYLDSVGWSEGWAASDPFLGAIRTLYNEGIAGLRSIENPRWAAPDGVLTEFARATLADLQPRMIERLAGLAANPPADEAARLLRNISQGKLTQKWGSIPIALWLAQATGFRGEKIARWVEARPDGILGLAVKYGDAQRRPVFSALLEEARERSAVAHGGPGRTRTRNLAVMSGQL